MSLRYLGFFAIKINTCIIQFYSRNPIANVCFSSKNDDYQEKSSLLKNCSIDLKQQIGITHLFNT